MQPMIPPKCFDISFPLIGRCSEGLDAFRFFFKLSPYPTSLEHPIKIILILIQSTSDFESPILELDNKTNYNIAEFYFCLAWIFASVLVCTCMAVIEVYSITVVLSSTLYC